MTISNEPLLTDIYEMIRTKINGVTALTNLLGKDTTTTKLLRVFRFFPISNVSYPRIVMFRSGEDNLSNHKTAIDYFITLNIYTKNSRTDEDTIKQQLMILFDDDVDTNYNQDNTKIDRVRYQSTGATIFDDTNKVWISPIELQVRARRKSNIA